MKSTLKNKILEKKSLMRKKKLIIKERAEEI